MKNLSKTDKFYVFQNHFWFVGIYLNYKIRNNLGIFSQRAKLSFYFQYKLAFLHSHERGVTGARSFFPERRQWARSFHFRGAIWGAHSIFWMRARSVSALQKSRSDSSPAEFHWHDIHEQCGILKQCLAVQDLAVLAASPLASLAESFLPTREVSKRWQHIQALKNLKGPIFAMEICIFIFTSVTNLWQIVYMCIQ